MNYDLILYLVFALFSALGIAMTFVPMMPALFYMLSLSFIFALIDGFVHLTWWNLTILFGIFVISFLVDTFSGILGAKYFGASKKAFYAGIIGLALGLIIFPPLGGLAGLFSGVLIGELLQARKSPEALRSAVGTLFGSVVGMIINSGLAIIFWLSFLLLAWK